MRDELARLHPHAFAWAMRCCQRDQPEAEDALHLAYCKVLEGRAVFEGRSTFKTWLFGVIQRTSREQARWKWLRLARLERWWQGSEGGGQHAATDREDSVGVLDERVSELRGALARLSPRQQEVLHLVFYQDMTIQEAAGVLAMRVGTARTHYERGKSRLRQLLLASEET